MSAFGMRILKLWSFAFLFCSTAVAMDINDPCYSLLQSHCLSDAKLADDIDLCAKELGEKVPATCEALHNKARQEYRANYVDDAAFLSRPDPKAIRHAEKLGLDPVTGLRRVDFGSVSFSFFAHFSDFRDALARAMGLSPSLLNGLLLGLMGYLILCWASWIALASQLNGRVIEMLIPGHNVVLILKGASLHEAWFFALCLPGINIPVYVMVLYRWARRFDKGIATALAAFFLPPYLWLMPVVALREPKSKS